MSTLKIVEWPAKILESKAAEVTDFDRSLQSFAQGMHSIMDQEGGIGLAANQVSRLQRLITIYIPYSKQRYAEDEKEKETWWHNQRFTLVNPVILERKGRSHYVEGCLSFPDVFEFVERFSEVKVRACDEFGKEFTLEANGLFSVCLQHEIDHLDGVVFINRMSRLKANTIRKKILGRIKERTI